MYVLLTYLLTYIWLTVHVCCRFLGGNDISCVEGLSGLGNLQELYVENQRLRAGDRLEFEPESLNAVAVSWGFRNHTLLISMSTLESTSYSVSSASFYSLFLTFFSFHKCNFIFFTVSVCYSFSFSLQAENSPFQPILPTIDCLYRLFQPSRVKRFLFW